MTTTQGTMAAPAEQKYSGVLLFLGIALVILGLLAVAYSIFFTLSAVLFVGVVLLAAGIVELIHAFRSRGKSTEKLLFNVISGILYVIAGGIAIANPVLGAMTLTLAMSIFFIIEGIIRIGSVIVHRNMRYWGWFLLGGVIDLVLGVLIAVGWPATGLWIIGLFVGIEMIFYGIAWIDLALRSRTIERTFGSGQASAV